MIVNTAHAAATRLSLLARSGPSTAEYQRHPDAYLGYDARDKDDYLTEGIVTSHFMSIGNMLIICVVIAVRL